MTKTVKNFPKAIIKIKQEYYILHIVTMKVPLQSSTQTKDKEVGCIYV